MKIRKYQIIKQLCNYILKILCLLAFFLIFWHFKLLLKYLFVCFVLFFFLFLGFLIFCCCVFLKNSHLITKVGKNRLNMEKNKF